MEQSLWYNWESGAADNPFLFDTNSEVAEALFAFLDDSSFLHLDDLFNKDVDVNGGEEGFSLLLPSPKRHCGCSEFYIGEEQPPPLFEQSSFFYPVVEPTMAVEELLDMPTMAAAAGECGGSGLSVQSVAARERRKRISEKTQELGRLIPGGTKMNTAEMLQAAFKYVKFLQAQVGVLRLMDSFPECKIAKEEDLQILLASPAIQERLSAEGMCIISQEMVDELSADPQIKSRPLISRSMNQFIEPPIVIDNN